MENYKARIEELEKKVIGLEMEIQDQYKVFHDYISREEKILNELKASLLFLILN